MTPNEWILWREVDRSVDCSEREQAKSVLADFYEECGAVKQSTLLRASGAQHALQACGAGKIADIITQMNPRSARLFCCACVDQTLGAPRLSNVASMLTLIRRDALGWDAKQELIAAQDACYLRWNNASSYLSADHAHRRVLWAMVRASGLLSRKRADITFTSDAVYTAIGTRSKRQNETGWNIEQQIEAAAEYLLLGRRFVESKEMITLLTETGDQ
ncbi:MAG: hypothetical protein AB8B91_12110 [Rubripirellula sp.]